MYSLTDFPSEMWGCLLTHLQSRHFVRLVMTGDALLHRRLRAIKGRHFNVPARFAWLGREQSCGTMLAIVTARSLTLNADQLEALKYAPISLPLLVNVELVAPERNYASQLPFTDFGPFARLQSLKIRGFDLVRALSLPLSLTSLEMRNARFWDCPLVAPIENLALLTSLTNLHIVSEFSGPIRHSADTTWPPSLESLSTSVVGMTTLAHLPRTLTNLELALSVVGKVDIFDLVSNYCPKLVSLVVRGEVTVSSRVPLGLEVLTVHGYIRSTQTSSLAETFERLPRSLNRLHFFCLTGTDLLPALQCILPRLGFGDFDSACKAVLRRCKGVDAETVGCLHAHAVRWFDNDHRIATAYLDAIRYTFHHRAGDEADAISAEDLFAIAGAIGDDLSRRVFPALIDNCRVIMHMPSMSALHQYRYRLSAKMLELGVSNSLHLSGDTDYVLPDDSAHNLVKLTFEGHLLGLGGMETFFQTNGVLTRLERIAVGDDKHSIDDIVDTLHSHKSKLPTVQRVTYSTHRIHGDFGTVSAASAAKMAEMRLYQQKARKYSVSFVYRIAPPRTSATQHDIEL